MADAAEERMAWAEGKPPQQAPAAAETEELKKIENLSIYEAAAPAQSSGPGLDDGGSEIKFLEVTCKNSGKIRRFAAGTEAGFALDLMNRKLGSTVAHALYIEAVKEGEEPISFGPNAILINYGKGWKLQTATYEGNEDAKPLQNTPKPFPSVVKSSDFHFAKKPAAGSSSTINFQYIGKILVAFLFIFILGGSLTLFLENLPRLILFISSSF